MKKLPVILNIVLIVAVGVLYFLHFSGSNPQSKGKTVKSARSATAEDISVAYVNMDTLLNNLDKFYDLRNQLMSKQQQSQKELDNNMKAFEQQVMDLDNKMQKGLITRSNAMKREEELKQEQERLLRLREDLTYKLAEEEQVMNRQVMDEIMDFLKTYNQDKNYQMVISNVYGGTLLYAEDSLNITQDVIEGLNDRYQSAKK
jgi:outer membrane protein